MEPTIRRQFGFLFTYRGRTAFIFLCVHILLFSFYENILTSSCFVQRWLHGFWDAWCHGENSWGAYVYKCFPESLSYISPSSISNWESPSWHGSYYRLCIRRAGHISFILEQINSISPSLTNMKYFTGSSPTVCQQCWISSSSREICHATCTKQPWICKPGISLFHAYTFILGLYIWLFRWPSPTLLKIIHQMKIIRIFHQAKIWSAKC